MDYYSKKCFLKGFIYGLTYMEVGSLKQFNDVCDEYNEGFIKVMNELDNLGYNTSHHVWCDTPTDICYDILEEAVEDYKDFNKWFEKEIGEYYKKELSIKDKLIKCLLKKYDRSDINKNSLNVKNNSDIEYLISVESYVIKDFQHLLEDYEINHMVEYRYNEDFLCIFYVNIKDIEKMFERVL